MHSKRVVNLHAYIKIPTNLKLTAKILVFILLLTSIATGCSTSIDNLHILQTIADFDSKDPNKAPINNKEKIYRGLGGWPKPPLYQGGLSAQKPQSHRRLLRFPVFPLVLLPQSEEPPTTNLS
jgi:hypothetical protein